MPVLLTWPPVPPPPSSQLLPSRRGRQLKVPEVVPFRLTQMLVAALGPGGTDGAFRAGAARALGALRANAQPLLALLEAALADPAVDWNAEGVEKRARQGFEEAVTLQLFAGRIGDSSAVLRAAAQGAGAALGACHEAAAEFVRLYGELSAAAARAAESHALQQRCEATLGTAAGQEQRLTQAGTEGRQSAEALLAQAQPLAAEAWACLQDCQAWQQHHEAILSVLATAPPPELTAVPALWRPAAAAVPLGLVTAFSPQGGSVLQAALGMAPSDAPTSASALLQASNLDVRGLQLLAQRADTCQQLVSLLQQYCAALCYLLGGGSYASTSGHAAWLAAFQAAVALPPPQVRGPSGFDSASALY